MHPRAVKAQSSPQYSPTTPGEQQAHQQLLMTVYSLTCWVFTMQRDSSATANWLGSYHLALFCYLKEFWQTGLLFLSLSLQSFRLKNSFGCHDCVRTRNFVTLCWNLQLSACCWESFIWCARHQPTTSQVPPAHSSHERSTSHRVQLLLQKPESVT